MSRALRSAVSDLLGQPRLRGAELLAALEEAGRTHGAEPFEACLAMLTHRRRPAIEPRKVVAGIETHRSGLEQRLGRDPGFVVAAMDFLQGTARTATADSRGAESWDTFEERLEAELRRCRRSRRPLALLLLVPFGGPGCEALERAEAALREALRDSDFLGRLVPPAFAIALPENAAPAAGRAASRLARIAARAAGVSFRCGVSVARDGEGEGGALLREARKAVELRSSERRRHRRSEALGVRARLVSGDSARDTRLLDVSAAGARVADDGLPEGSAVRLSLVGPAPRAEAATVPARVASRRSSPEGEEAILLFEDGDPAVAELAALLSGLPHGPREGRS
jgi:GGDEF domain-containing protein